jgi:hypothetical protein
MSARIIASTLLMLACLAARATYSEQTPADIEVGNTIYKVVDRIVLADALVFHKPQNSTRHPCIAHHVTMDGNKDGKNCSVPGGRPSYRVLGCGGTVSFVPETPAETFARVPGRDAPNLFASIVGAHIGKHNEGELEIAILVCGLRIAVPVLQDRPNKGRSSYRFNRLSLRISGPRGVAELTLGGIETRSESFRIAGMNQAVLFIVPFKALGPLKIERDEGFNHPQTQSIDLLSGKFELGSYSASDKRYTEDTEREVVPAGHHPVRVDSSRE